MTTISWAWGFYPNSVPPGFRLRGTYFGGDPDTCSLEAQIAQNMHVDKLTIPAYGDIDLKNVSPVSFPGGDSYELLRTAGHTMEIPGKAKLNIVELVKGPGSYGHEYLTVLLRLVNLNAGYDTTVNISLCALGDNGLLSFPEGRLSEADMRKGLQLTVGPARTVETKVQLEVPRGSKNLRLVLTGDFGQEVFDTGY